MAIHRATIARVGKIHGIGVHLGDEAIVTLLPAAPGTGVVFRTDGTDIPAALDSVSDTARRTALSANGHTVDTVEHLLAALYGADIHDVTVQIEGPELPIGDGSAQHFADLLDNVGRVESDLELDAFAAPESFNLAEGESAYRYTSSDIFSVEVEIDWEHPLIGHQRFRFGPESSFRNELCAARTFVLESEVQSLREQGLLKGGTLDCGIVLTESGLASGELRWPDEFVRHKTLDLLGDLTLLGCRVLGEIHATRPSHRGNVRFARAFRERIRENAA